MRLLKRMLIREYNGLILDLASKYEPSILLAFKGPYIEARTLHILRTRGIALYNYYPDRVVLAGGTMIEETLPEYDCLFDTKKFWDAGAQHFTKPRERVFVPHGYDPEVHQPLALSTKDISEYQCDVSCIATHSPRKEKILKELVISKPSLDLRIWGNQWVENCQSSELRKYINGSALVGNQYVKAIRSARINLAIMGILPTVKDETTTRTYEIPACAGFMLHERTEEVLDLYEEGKEIACFDSIQELGEKIDYYLAHAKERQEIALSGYTRCVPAYSYDNRMAEIIKWHQERHSIKPLSPAVRHLHMHSA